MASWHGAELGSILVCLQQEAPRLADEHAPSGFPPFFVGGSTEEEVRAAEAEHGRPVPGPVRQLNRAIRGLTPDDWCRKARDSATLIKSLAVTYWPHPLDVDDADERWNRNDYFVFAQTTDGDEIVYCEHPPEHRPGSIILLDHDRCNMIPAESDLDCVTQVVFLADSLAEWLARWMACGFIEPATTGEEELVPRDVYIDFLADHIRLNPRVVWARERLSELTQSGSGS